MADERYHWLDHETAERLLRGGPAEPADGSDGSNSSAGSADPADPADSTVERLAAALDAIRPRTAGAGLPGEEAALAAFREATAARTGAPGPVPAPGEPVDLGRVRLARPAAAPRRRARSARYGLAAAVAAVTVGGVAVAVAAGTGALPSAGPAPASSVTAGGTTRPLVLPEPGGVREDPGTPGPQPRGGDRTPDPSGSAGALSPAPTGPFSSPSSPPLSSSPPPSSSPSPDADGGNTAEREVPAPDRSTAGAKRSPEPDPGRTRDRGGQPGTELREKARDACLSYRAGTLDDSGRRHLTGTLRAGETLRRYCDRILSATTGTENGTKDTTKGGRGSAPRADDRPGDGRGTPWTRSGNGRTGPRA